MSLDFDVRRIRSYDPERHGTNREPSLVTRVLIFGTMNTGIPRVTDAKVPEFYARLKVIERFIGPLIVNGDGTPYALSADEVRDHVGLGTNASAMSTPTFTARVAKQVGVAKPEVVEVWRAAHAEYLATGVAA